MKPPASRSWMKRRKPASTSSKLYQPMDIGPNDRHLSAYHIRRACEASLRRLKTDQIDLYQTHHIDRATPWEEICTRTHRGHRAPTAASGGCALLLCWNAPHAHLVPTRSEPPGPCTRLAAGGRSGAVRNRPE